MMAAHTGPAKRPTEEPWAAEGSKRANRQEASGAGSGGDRRGPRRL
jgi:hypothetical protein